MSLAHLTLPTRDVEKTASFLERTLGYLREPVPENIPCETVWLNIGLGQQVHVFYVRDLKYRRLNASSDVMWPSSTRARSSRGSSSACCNTGPN